jgi:hypothetical protein
MTKLIFTLLNFFFSSLGLIAVKGEVLYTYCHFCIFLKLQSAILPFVTELKKYII